MLMFWGHLDASVGSMAVGRRDTQKGEGLKDEIFDTSRRVLSILERSLMSLKRGVGLRGL